VDYPYFVLYNRYTAVLRVFITVGGVAPAFNGAKFRFLFEPGAKTSALRDTTLALDQFRETTLGSASNFLNSDGRWFYADFLMNYDPCTCYYKTKMQIIVELLALSKVELVGQSDGKLINDASGSSQVDDKQSFSAGVVNGIKVLPKVYKSYKDVVKFTKDMDLEENPLKKLLGNSGFLKDGLKAAPWIAAAVGVLELFTGGGKKSSGPQEVKIMPMAINLNHKFTGSINFAGAYKTIRFATPGADNLSEPIDQYPLYNQPMGLFNLLKTPKFYYRTNTFCSTQFGVTLCQYSTDIILPDSLEYVINKAAGFRDSTEIYTALEFLYPNDQLVFTSRHIPIACLRDVSISTPSSLAPFLFKVKLKIIVNFKRQDATNDTQNVLYVNTFNIDAINKTNDNTINWSRSIYSSLYTQNAVYGAAISTPLDFSGGAKSAINTLTVVPGTTVQYTGYFPCSTCYESLLAGNSIEIQPPSGTQSTNILPQSILAISNFYQVNCTKYQAPSNQLIYTTCTSQAYRNPRAIPIIEPDSTESAVEEGDKSLKKSRLGAIYPNPTSGETVVPYEVSEAGQVKLYLNNSLGATVLNLVDKPQEAGQYTASIAGANLQPGVYFLFLEVGNQRSFKRLLVKE
jgi:hypothetical protein